MSYGFNNPYFRYDNNYSYGENNPDYDNYNLEGYDSYNNQEGIFIDEDPNPPNYEFKTTISNKINDPLKHSIYPYRSYKATNQNYTIPSESPVEIDYKKSPFTRGPDWHSPNQYIPHPCNSCGGKNFTQMNLPHQQPHYAGYVTSDRTNNANIFLSTGWDERPEDFNPGIQWLGNPNGFSNPNTLINPNLLLNPTPLINPYPLKMDSIYMNSINHPIAKPLEQPLEQPIIRQLPLSSNFAQGENNFLNSPNFILKILLIIILIILFAMLVSVIYKKKKEKTKQLHNYLVYVQ
jgi:hypothetical protein